MMRIITGLAKGTRLKAPKGMDTRPTADRVKESMFNILGDIVVDAKVLDLFGGTGNLGLEALSRGAAKAIFIDQNQNSINAIKENINLCKLQGQALVYKMDSFVALGRLAREHYKFNLIFCDPPYNKGLVEKTLTKLEENEILEDEAIIVVEHSKHELITSDFSNYEVRRSEKYGETIVSFILYKISS